MDSMIDVLMCKKEVLPIKYLGLPIGANMKKKESWQPVIDKIEGYLANWKGKLLSIGGRVTLIKATLSNLPVYFLSLFKIPKGVAQDIAKIQRRFLWAGNKEEGRRFISSLNWETIELPKTLGGLGVGNLLARNVSLLFKWIWRYTTEENALWRRFISAKYQTDVACNFSSLQVPNRGGPWKVICKEIKENSKAFELAKEGMRWKLGDGGKIHFWTDVWIGTNTLSELFPRLYALSINRDATISSMGLWDGGDWHWILSWRRGLFVWERELENDLLQKLQSVYLDTSRPDETIWSLTSLGNYTCKSFYNEYLSKCIHRDIPVIQGIWRGLVPHKIEIFVWLACLNRIKSKKWLFDRGIIHNPNELTCLFCDDNIEDTEHLFFNCIFAKELWSVWFNQWQISWVWNKNFQDNFLAWRSPWKPKIHQKVWSSAFFVIIWTIWKERNDRLNSNKCNSMKAITDLFWLRLAWWKKGWHENFSYSPEDVVRCPQCILWDDTQVTPSVNTDIVWEPPPAGRLKWNVDASQFHDENGISLAIGGVLRDQNGVILCLFSIPIDGTGINDAEYMAILKALELSAAHQQYGNFIIESDSTNAVRWCLNLNRQPWAMNFISNRIQALLRDFNGVIIQYRSRSSNTFADGLAKLANLKKRTLIAWL